MSQRYVRDTIRLWAVQVFACPFVDTINAVMRDDLVAPFADAVWSTVQFDPATDGLADFCGGQSSSGVADFIFSGPPNAKDSDVLWAAEESIRRLMLLNDPSGRLTLVYAHAPEEFSNGTADHSYRVFVAVEYRYFWSQKDPAQPMPVAATA